MSLTGINLWTVVGNLGADAEIKEVTTRGGESTSVAEATLYVRRRRRDDSFLVKVSIWKNSDAWRSVQYLKKGSLICVVGAVEPSPYISNTTKEARAGLQIDPVNRIELISVKDEDGDDNNGSQADSKKAPAQKSKQKQAA